MAESVRGIPRNPCTTRAASTALVVVAVLGRSIGLIQLGEPTIISY